jgi:hypothetical protein
MTKTFLLHWVPGSGGDMIRAVLVQSGMFSNSESGTIDYNGRSVRTLDSTLEKLFPSVGAGWHNLDWTKQDLGKLEDLVQSSQRPWIIGTHKFEQLKFLKDTLKTPVVTIGINYGPTMYPAVIKNWCKKAATESYENDQIYSKSHPVLMPKLKEQGLWPEFMLKEILNHIDNIPKSMNFDFDVAVQLEQLYNGNLDCLKAFVNKNSLSVFDAWINKQDDLYKFYFPASNTYKQILGYNSLAINKINSLIQLSSLDQILIQHFCKKHNLNKPSSIQTHQDLLNFLQEVQL